MVAFRDMLNNVLQTVSQVLPGCHICGAPGAQVCVECQSVSCHRHAYTNVGSVRSVCSKCVSSKFPWASSDLLQDLPENWPYEEPPWEILGVAQDASVEEINRAHREVSMMFHPDRENGDEARQKAVNHAREVLLQMRQS